MPINFQKELLTPTNGKSWPEKIYRGVGWIAGGFLGFALKIDGLIAEATTSDSEQGKLRREAWVKAGGAVKIHLPAPGNL